jgi:hypothetical protein
MTHLPFVVRPPSRDPEARKALICCRIPAQGRDDDEVAREERRVGPDSRWYYPAQHEGREIK